MLWILLLLGAGGVVGVMVYNRLVIAQNQYRNAFSQIGVQLQRRHDLIPNLVAAAKGYLKPKTHAHNRTRQASLSPCRVCHFLFSGSPNQIGYLKKERLPETPYLSLLPIGTRGNPV